MVTELVSCDGIIHGSQQSRTLLFFSPIERPISIQLFGGDPDVVAGASRIVAELKPDIIDLNVGCPVPKVTRQQCGAALLRNLPLLYDIVKALVTAVDIPVTAKIRSGWDETKINAVEVAQLLQAAGVKAIALHARTRAQRHEGPPDLEIIRKVVQSVEIPVIGNGDIQSGDDAREMIVRTGCAAVMIGRGAIGRPWLFREVNDCIDGLAPPPPPSVPEQIAICLEHLAMEISEKGERRATLEMRKIFGGYVHGWEASTALRMRLQQAEIYADVEAIFADYQRQQVV